MHIANGCVILENALCIECMSPVLGIKNERSNGSDKDRF